MLLPHSNCACVRYPCDCDGTVYDQNGEPLYMLQTPLTTTDKDNITNTGVSSLQSFILPKTVSQGVATTSGGIVEWIMNNPLISLLGGAALIFILIKMFSKK